MEKLQHMSSSEGRFKNMREAVHRCDPPCIPYLGMYLSDLTFIEEGTPNMTEENLINYSKMRMVRLLRLVRAASGIGEDLARRGGWALCDVSIAGS